MVGEQMPVLVSLTGALVFSNHGSPSFESLEPAARRAIEDGFSADSDQFVNALDALSASEVRLGWRSISTYLRILVRTMLL